jgi:hypothetical protein
MESSDEFGDPDRDGVSSVLSSSSPECTGVSGSEKIASSSGWKEFCRVLLRVLGCGRIEPCLRGADGRIRSAVTLGGLPSVSGASGRGLDFGCEVYIFGTPGVRSVLNSVSTN